ncbi:MAG: DUF805 domain-containing protein [Gammaproteobacteria bacterium]|nr:DUF805 domain-containing protein [Gammaproteobacteria bacterium]
MTNEHLSPQVPSQTRPSRLSPAGRLGRVRFLAYNMVVSLAVMTVLFIVGFVGALVFGDQAETAQLLTGLVTLLVMIPALVISVIFLIKRCHDFDASGWWCIPGVIGALIPLVNLIVFLVYALIPGTDGDNRFGPATPPNTVLHWVLAILFPLVFVVGVLAAIAIPAYQDYTSRAMMGEAFTSVGDAKTAVVEFANRNGRYPSAADIAALDMDVIAGAQYVASVEVMPDNGEIVVTMQPAPATNVAVAGQRVSFCPPRLSDLGPSPAVFTWRCSSTVDSKYLPRSCDAGKIRECP